MTGETHQNILFGSEINPPLGWRSYATSFAVHIGILVLLLLIPVAATHEGRQHLRDMATLIAPQLKPYKPPPRVQPPKVLAKSVLMPKPVAVVKPPVLPKPVLPPAPVLRETPKPVEQPQIAAAEPKPMPRITTPEPKPAPALRPQVHTGVFGSEEAAKKVEVAKQLAVGGFGDPNGAKANPDSKSTLIAKVGSFEMPQGDGNAGGHGGQGQGVVRSTSFGSMDGGGSGPGGNGAGIGHGTVRTGGFGAAETGNGTGGNGRGGTVKTGGFGDDSANVQSQPIQRAQAKTPATTPVEIVSKPKPVYTPEARAMHLEGEVSLEVVFTASGSVQIVRVVRGLGHGLDQAAQQAAAQIRFHPSTRDGVPVDTRATIHIVFELT